MTTNKQGRNGGNRATPKASDSPDHTKTDQLIGWHALAVNVKAAPAKRNWKGGRK